MIGVEKCYWVVCRSSKTGGISDDFCPDLDKYYCEDHIKFSSRLRSTGLCMY